PNHLDATVFVNKRLDIMAEDLAEVLDKVSKIVLAAAVTEADMAELRNLFAREYDLRDKAPRIKPSRGRDFARLSYGEESGRTLSDILDSGLYQPEWSDYKGVILLDDSISAFHNSLVDLDYAEEEEYDDEPQDDDKPEESVGKEGEIHTYVFALPVSLPEGRSNLEFELESSKTITHCPVAGYEVAGRLTEGQNHSNKLRRTKGKTLYEKLERWIWGAGGVIAGIILMAIVGLFRGGEPKPSQQSDMAETSVKITQTPENKTKVKTPQSSAATAYLDANRIWRQEEMEKIDGLAGLFDDLNNYRFDEITGKWADSLGGSENFAKVVKAAKKSVAKHNDPLRGEE
ncbi:MAG: hypothetical protein K2I89_04795, partial [Muribaculaceae bacterium]|nr:hypothetical protein [Muribaculaceae bacterium]